MSVRQSAPSGLTPHQIAAVLLALFAFGMSVLVSDRVFEGLPHLEDEVAYLYQAKVFASGHIVAEIPEPRRSYWQPFVVDYAENGTRFGKYTPGWPLMLSIGVLLGQWWIMNAVFSALNVALIFRLGREIFGADTGLIGATLAAFSPMALLLNASLMAHTAALTYALAFIYSYWRMMHGSHPLRWGLLAGAALGLMLITRPLTSVGVALPFIVWSGLRLLRPLLDARPRDSLRVLGPLLALSIVTLSIGSAVPLFNAAATGDPTQNLYELVWHYDRVGFGECCGRNGHTLEKGVRHTRFDLSLTAADLFGWHVGPITDEQRDHFVTSSAYYPGLGLSFVLLPLGLLVGTMWQARSRVAAVGRGVLALIWVGLATGWAMLPLYLDTSLLTSPDFGTLWVGLALVIVMLPLGVVIWLKDSPGTQFTWLLTAVMLSIVVLQMAYWIGSQRYSTRYYFEGLAAAALLSALPLSWLARRWGGRLRLLVYPALLLACAYSLIAYSTPRISTLYRFNTIGQHDLEALEARRTNPEQPVLVLVNGPPTGDDRVRWRSMGTYMAVTDPFLDSDIVVAWDNGWDGVRQQILDRFPDREIIEMDATGNEATFRD